MAFTYWFVWSSHICRYHQKEDFEIHSIRPDDKSIFSVVHDVDLSTNHLNDDLSKISEWDFSGKCLSILVCLSKRKKFSFLVKLIK